MTWCVRKTKPLLWPLCVCVCVGGVAELMTTVLMTCVREGAQLDVLCQKGVVPLISNQYYSALCIYSEISVERCFFKLLNSSSNNRNNLSLSASGDICKSSVLIVSG